MKINGYLDTMCDEMRTMQMPEQQRYLVTLQQIQQYILPDNTICECFLFLDNRHDDEHCKSIAYVNGLV